MDNKRQLERSLCERGQSTDGVEARQFFADANKVTSLQDELENFGYDKRGKVIQMICEVLPPRCTVGLESRIFTAYEFPVWFYP